MLIGSQLDGIVDSQLPLKFFDRFAGLIRFQIQDVRIDAISKRHNAAPGTRRGVFSARGKDPRILLD